MRSSRQPLGIGVDIAEIRRFKGKDRRTDLFLRAAFTKSELRYCFSKRNPAQHLAARFAAKEAAWKAVKGLTADASLYGFLQELEVVNAKDGMPRLRFLSPKLKKYSPLVSLAHSKTHAIAFVCVAKV